jgi:hypothetical protein
MNAVDWPALNRSADIAEAARDAAAEAARAEHQHRLRTDRDYALSVIAELREQLEDARKAMRRAIETARDGRAEEVGGSEGSALGACIAIEQALSVALEVE